MVNLKLNEEKDVMRWVRDGDRDVAMWGAIIQSPTEEGRTWRKLENLDQAHVGDFRFGTTTLEYIVSSIAATTLTPIDVRSVRALNLPADYPAAAFTRTIWHRHPQRRFIVVCLRCM